MKSTLPEVMEAFKAHHDGKGPATNDEFMGVPPRRSHIGLPDLPAGHRYVYDPAKEQLTVEKDSN